MSDVICYEILLVIIMYSSQHVFSDYHYSLNVRSMCMFVEWSVYKQMFHRTFTFLSFWCSFHLQPFTDFKTVQLAKNSVCPCNYFQKPEASSLNGLMSMSTWCLFICRQPSIKLFKRINLLVVLSYINRSLLYRFLSFHSKMRLMILIQQIVRPKHDAIFLRM